MGAQGSQLGAEEERAAEPAVVEGLLADPVARQRQRAFRPVPQGECEHALDAPEGSLGAPMVDCGEQDLGVGVATEGIAAGLELGPKPQEIVDLAIERDDVAARSREHRLVAGRRRVDDGKTPMAQSQAGRGVNPRARAIRSAMLQRSGHRPHQALVVAIALVAPEKSRDAAHPGLAEADRRLNTGRIRGQGTAHKRVEHHHQRPLRVAAGEPGYLAVLLLTPAPQRCAFRMNIMKCVVCSSRRQALAAVASCSVSGYGSSRPSSMACLRSGAGTKATGADQRDNRRNCCIGGQCVAERPTFRHEREDAGLASSFGRSP